MKRPDYLITSSVGHKVVKHAWNSAQREVELMVRDIAKSEGVRYRLVYKHSVQGDDKKHVYGSRQWLGDNGNQIGFIIAKQ